MKKSLPLLLAFLSIGFINVHAQNLSSSPTLIFSHTAGFDDNIATDGEGGAAAISDINIQVLPVNNSGTKMTADPLEFHGADWGTPPIITYGGLNPFYAWSIRSDNGADFPWLLSTYTTGAIGQARPLPCRRFAMVYH